MESKMTEQNTVGKTPEVQPTRPTPTDMRPFAERLIGLTNMNPSVCFKNFLDLCQECAPFGFSHLKKVYELQERNLGALQVAAKREEQLVQDTFVRQREIMASGIAEAWSAAGEILLAGPMDKVAGGARYLKEASMKIIDNYVEIGKRISDTQKNVSQILCNRADDYIQELKSLFSESKPVHH
jgi:hypothetical protein